MTANEKQQIVAGLVEGLTLLDLAKDLGRDKRTLVSFSKTHNTKFADRSTGNQMTPALPFLPKLSFLPSDLMVQMD